MVISRSRHSRCRRCNIPDDGEQFSQSIEIQQRGATHHACTPIDVEHPARKLARDSTACKHVDELFAIFDHPPDNSDSLSKERVPSVGDANSLASICRMTIVPDGGQRTRTERRCALHDRLARSLDSTVCRSSTSDQWARDRRRPPHRAESCSNPRRSTHHSQQRLEPCALHRRRYVQAQCSCLDDEPRRG